MMERQWPHTPLARALLCIGYLREDADDELIEPEYPGNLVVAQAEAEISLDAAVSFPVDI